MKGLEAHAVGALVHAGVGLVGAHLNAVQAAVVHVLAVVCAAGHGALDGAVGGAAAAVVGAICVHGSFLRKIKSKQPFAGLLTVFPKSGGLYKVHFPQSKDS